MIAFDIADHTDGFSLQLWCLPQNLLTRVGILLHPVDVDLFESRKIWNLWIHALCVGGIFIKVSCDL